MLNQNFLNKSEVTSKTKLIGYKTMYILLETYGCESYYIYNSIRNKTIKMGLGISPRTNERISRIEMVL
jgi:hypothetical protein